MYSDIFQIVSLSHPLWGSAPTNRSEQMLKAYKLKRLQSQRTEIKRMTDNAWKFFFNDHCPSFSPVSLFFIVRIQKEWQGVETDNTQSHTATLESASDVTKDWQVKHLSLSVPTYHSASLLCVSILSLHVKPRCRFCLPQVLRTAGVCLLAAITL